MNVSDTLETVTLGQMMGLKRPGESLDSPTAVLLHGYGGDERVMWVFSSAVPSGWTVIALRGTSPAEDGGYRWHLGRRWPPPKARAFAPAVEALRESVPSGREILWIGFSQGAALALCCAAAGLPTRGVACLAGYLPDNLTPLAPGLSVFWAHGRRDDKIPIDSARRAADRLRSWGVEFAYCEGENGHKIGADCLRALRTWMVRFEPQA